MKKSIITVLFLIMFFGSSCAGEKKIEGTVANQVTQKEDSDRKDLAQDEGISVENTAAEYGFRSGDTMVIPDEAAEAIIEGLGEPVNYFESKSCAFGDLDKIYNYNSFEVNTYSMEGVDYISSVVLKDDTVSTAEGLYIGGEASAVKEVYGEPDKEDLNLLSYASEHSRLSFVIRDDKIASIEYTTRIIEK